MERKFCWTTCNSSTFQCAFYMKDLQTAWLWSWKLALQILAFFSFSWLVIFSLLSHIVGYGIGNSFFCRLWSCLIVNEMNEIWESWSVHVYINYILEPFLVLCLQILRSVIIIRILYYLGSIFGCFLLVMLMKPLKRIIFALLLILSQCSLSINNNN